MANFDRVNRPIDTCTFVCEFGKDANLRIYPKIGSWFEIMMSVDVD